MSTNYTIVQAKKDTYLWVEIDCWDTVWMLKHVQAVFAGNVPQSNSLPSNLPKCVSLWYDTVIDKQNKY